MQEALAELQAGASGSDGVLKPESYTNDSGETTTIQRIEWESGMVEMQPDNGPGFGTEPQSELAEHHVDFIALDGYGSPAAGFQRCSGCGGWREALPDLGRVRSSRGAPGTC